MKSSILSKRLLSGLLLLIFVLSAQAAIVAFKFTDPAKEARFRKFGEELRCLVCQNESLADSNAELALDLRRVLYKMIQNNATDKEIIAFMVDRYGDFVLYKPPVKPTTWLLWFGPFILVAVGLFILIRVIRNTRKQADTKLTEDEQKQLDSLLKNKKEEPRV
ncbi:Cytochrome c heme lyase subunit CcmL [hydrothermal vent metagenome]|uniref:Cytochrome c heme lyase subunit CcmL n=1 Tax=hydrothermal vent metagenome TaxID=652676 RepID=A0A3B1BP43_9ZZZZ